MTPDTADAYEIATRPFLITFSGIDGAGKTTQIEHLSSYLEKQGLRVLRLSFWDHVAAWSNFRAGVGHQAVGSGPVDRLPEHSFTPKNNKHVRKWYLTAARSGLYMLDVARLHRLLGSESVRKADVVIFDRYIYDQIANIDSQSRAARIYGKLLLQQAPAPDLAFVIDASPAEAFARKPEYPLEFMHRNRETFLRLRELVPELIIISEGTENDVKSEIFAHVRRSRLLEGASTEGKTEVPVDSAVVRLQSSCSTQNDPTASVQVPSKGCA
jgi:thymidylate kinase